jgi:hypothetical protein
MFVHLHHLLHHHGHRRVQVVQPHPLAIRQHVGIPQRRVAATDRVEHGIDVLCGIALAAAVLAFIQRYRKETLA